MGQSILHIVLSNSIEIIKTQYSERIYEKITFKIFAVIVFTVTLFTNTFASSKWVEGATIQKLEINTPVDYLSIKFDIHPTNGEVCPGGDTQILSLDEVKYPHAKTWMSILLFAFASQKKVRYYISNEPSDGCMYGLARIIQFTVY